MLVVRREKWINCNVNLSGPLVQDCSICQDGVICIVSGADLSVAVASTKYSVFMISNQNQKVYEESARRFNLKIVVDYLKFLNMFRFTVAILSS